MKQKMATPHFIKIIIIKKNRDMYPEYNFNIFFLI